MDIEQFRQMAAAETLPRKRFNKLFCIGANKTGTTTLELVFNALGYRMPSQVEQEMRISLQLWQGNLLPLQEFCARYDAFQDLPFAIGQAYVQADALFPGSKFILTLREPDAWFDSLKRFHLKGVLSRAGVTDTDQVDEETLKDQNVYLYQNYFYEISKHFTAVVRDGEVEYDWDLLYDREHRIKLYNQRNEAIIRYFKDRPDDLLVIDVTQEQDISRILDFLGLPAKLNFQMPHLNRSK